MPYLVDPVVAAGAMANAEQPVLEARGLRLRPWLVQDADILVAAYADQAIQHWHARRFDSSAEAAAYIEQWHKAWNAESSARWAVTDAETEEVLGQAGLLSVHLAGGEAGTSYWVLRHARGRGVAARAIGIVAEWALHELGLHRLELEHSVGNTESCRVAHRAGFALEGTMAEKWPQTDGWHDVHLHARVLTRAP